MNYTVEEAVEAYIEAIDIVNGDYDWKINSYEKQRFDRPLDSYLIYSKKIKTCIATKTWKWHWWTGEIFKKFRKRKLHHNRKKSKRLFKIN